MGGGISAEVAGESQAEALNQDELFAGRVRIVPTLFDKQTVRVKVIG